jgi:tetratricopeptide (TPR) repeat protein
MFSLGQRIRELRTKKRLSQSELSKGICTPSMVSQIEADRARPSYKILYALADRLETSLDKLLVDVDMNLEFISSFKMAKAMVASKSYVAAIPLLKDVLYGQRTVISEMEIHFELALCYLHTGMLSEAETMLASVQEHSILRGDAYMLAQTLKCIGEMEYKRGRYRLAVFQWKKAIAEVDKLEHQDLYLKAGLFYDLGTVHNKMGLLTEGVEYFRSASDLYHQTDKLEDIAGVYMVLGQSYKRLNDYEKAAEYSGRALAIYEGLENAYMSVKVQLSSAISLAQSGQEREAVQWLETVIQKFQELGKQEDAALTYVEIAKVWLALKQPSEAEEACRVARAMLTDLHPGMAWVHHVLGQVAYERGDIEEATRKLQRAADQFKSLGELREWGDTMSEISRLRYEQNDLLTAISIMKDIRAYTHQVLKERGIVL